VLALPATAARPRSGSWAGETAQGNVIRFAVSTGKREVRDLRVAFRAGCARGPAISGTTTFAGPFPVQRGRFRVSGSAMRIRGTFEKRGRATGRLRWEGRSFRPDGSSRACDSGRIRWSARRG
jgi:hypothetical protein